MDDCYSSERFVDPENLDEIMEWFDSKISELTELRITQLLWLLGPADSGKSWLAAYLFKNLLNKKFSGHMIFLAFGKNSPLEVNNQCFFYVHPAEQTDQKGIASYSKIQEIQVGVANIMDLQGVLTALPIDYALGQLLKHADDKPFFIVIDGIDEGDLVFLKAFENYFLQPFYNVRKQCLVLLTGRRLHTWKDVKLRQFPPGNTKELRAFKGEWVDKFFAQNYANEALLTTELGKILKPSAYPGHIVRAVELWKKDQDVCKVFDTMVEELWKETGLTSFQGETGLILSWRVGLDLAKVNSGFTRGELQGIFANHFGKEEGKGFPSWISQQWIQKLVESRILYFDSDEEMWFMDDAYKRLFDLCRDCLKNKGNLTGLHEE